MIGGVRPTPPGSASVLVVTLGKSLYSRLLLSTQEYKWVPVRAEMAIVNDLAAVYQNGSIELYTCTPQEAEMVFGVFHGPSEQGNNVMYASRLDKSMLF